MTKYLVDRDEVIQVIHGILYEYMSNEEEFTPIDKLLLTLNKVLSTAIKAIDPQIIEGFELCGDGKAFVEGEWIPTKEEIAAFEAERKKENEND